MTGFGKTCIVHTSNFSILVLYKIYLEWHIDVKLSGIVNPLFLYHSWKFQICIPFSGSFTDLQMTKIGCVNYAHFPKSGHNLILLNTPTYDWNWRRWPWWNLMIGYRIIVSPLVLVKWFITGISDLLCVLLEISRDSLQECIFDSLELQAQDVWQDLAKLKDPNSSS